MPTNLPTNIDVTYADDPLDPSKKIHQQQHDIIAAALNALSDTTALDPYSARAYSDSKLATGVAVATMDRIVRWDGTAFQPVAYRADTTVPRTFRSPASVDPALQAGVIVRDDNDGFGDHWDVEP